MSDPIEPTIWTRLLDESYPDAKPSELTTARIKALARQQARPPAHRRPLWMALAASVVAVAGLGLIMQIQPSRQDSQVVPADAGAQAATSESITIAMLPGKAEPTSEGTAALKALVGRWDLCSGGVTVQLAIGTPASSSAARTSAVMATIEQAAGCKVEPRRSTAAASPDQARVTFSTSG